MGKGKGAIDHYIARIKAGQVIFSLEGVSSAIAGSVLLKASRKLPMRTDVVQAATLLQYSL
jgi:large subunit ribosomal protein L16